MAVEKIKFVYDDGGRKKAGYKGNTRDCVCRSIAIATEQPYQKVYDDLNHLISSHRNTKQRRESHSRTGVHKKFYTKYLEKLGWEWFPCMKIGQGCKVHLRKDELPTGRLVLSLSRHLTAVVNGELHDVYDCSRNGTRCVYGYFIKKDE